MLEPLSPSEGLIKGEILTNYSTNSGLTASSLMLSGNHSGLVWRGRGTYKNAHSFKTPIGYFPNSGFNETSLSSMIGVNKRWGYSHLNFSYFKNNIGFYEPEFDHKGNYVDEDGNGFSEHDFRNRKLSFPRQDIRHYKLAWNNNIIASSGAFKINLGYQRNQRREMDEPLPALFLDLNTFNVELKYSVNEKQGWQPIFGLSAEAANSINKGSEFLLPDYTTSGIGGFTYIKKTWKKTTLNGGVRYDHRTNNGDSYTKEAEAFESYTNSFSNVSGAIGMTYELNRYFNFKANAGSAFRSPNPAELSSNGVHEGTFRYEIGNPSLKPERSYQADITLEYRHNLIDGGVSLYTNLVNDFIYISSQKGDEIDGIAIYRYGQVDAVLKGFEGNLNIHPVNNLHLHNTFAYTHAKNRSSGKPLPFIPAGVIKNIIRYEPVLKGIKQPYLSVGVDNFFKQARIDDAFETATSGYSLLNAAVGTTVSIRKQPINLYISGSNLLDQKYYDALSRLKPGRVDHNNLEIGIYNMGRNITFGLTLPI
ncbi:MAG: TonB-dependent receptor [Sphingobacterium sp.]